MALIALPPPAFVLPFRLADLSSPQGIEALAIQNRAREADRTQERWQIRLGGCAFLQAEELGYRHVPLPIVGTMKVRYGKPTKLNPRRIVLDE